MHSTKKQQRRRGRRPLTQTQRVWNAVERGYQDAKAIRKAARVPLKHVHPLLGRLRKNGHIEGYTASLRVIMPPTSRGKRRST